MTTRAELEQLAKLVNTYLGSDPDGDGFFVQGAYGRVRLMRDQGSREVSPSLTKSELDLWMRAFLRGIEAGHQTPPSRPAHPQALQLVQYAVADLMTLGEEEARSRGLQPVGGLTSQIPAYRAAARLEQAIPLLIDPDRAIATALRS